MSTIRASEVVRYPLRVRHVHVAATERLAPSMVRITFAGDSLEGFTAPAPSDHVKMFFPDSDGRLATPTVVDDRPVPPETGTVLARDYTPLRFRADAGELDVDFVLHGDDGPASAWAARAEAGSPLAFAGPRGSHLPPDGVRDAVVVADETALPAARRWIQHYVPEVSVTGLFCVADPGVTGYLDDVEGGSRTWLTGPDRASEVLELLRALTITGSTFVFLAGEAGMIMPLRRYLRHELKLPREQVDAHGYWKQGTINLDHHAPLDPSDPD